MVLLFIGILLTQLLYVITNWYQYRRYDYVIYALYISFFIIYYISIFPTEFTSNSNVFDIADSIKRPLAVLIYLVYFHFMDVFLDLKVKYPSLHRQVVFTQRMIMTLLIIQIGVVLAGHAVTSAGTMIYYGISFLLFGLSILFMIKVYKHKSRLAVTLLRGSICLATGAFITNILMVSGITTGRILTLADYIPLFLGTLLELFFFNLALAYKKVQEEISLADAQQLVIEKLQQNEQLIIEKQTTRNKIARDLHDEVGATLSGVTLFSELAIRELDQNKIKDISKHLERIDNECLAMSDKLDKILWAEDGVLISMDQLFEKVHEYTKPLCSTKSIHLSFNIDQVITKKTFNQGVYDHLFLFCKEAVTNAIKYAQGTTLEIQAKESGNRILITIQDNGKGFDVTGKFDGNGLKNMRSRAVDMQAEFIVASSEGLGTTIQLKIKTL